jgi:hypothetical protein
MAGKERQIHIKNCRLARKDRLEGGGRTPYYSGLQVNYSTDVLFYKRFRGKLEYFKVAIVIDMRNKKLYRKMKCWESGIYTKNQLISLEREFPARERGFKSLSPPGETHSLEWVFLINKSLSL